MRFVFLIFFSRSGSTMLARSLALNSSDLVVMPEFRSLELFLLEGDAWVRKVNSIDLFDLMDQDYMIKNLGLPERELREIAQRNRGRGIRNLISDISNAYASVQGKKPEVAMIQFGVPHLLNRLLEVFPETKLVHIVRDGRGVVNSLVRTERPYFPGEKMGRGDVYYSARIWTRFIQKIQKLSDGNRAPLLEIKYEDFCRCPSDLIRMITEYVGATYAPCKDDEEKYHFEVGDREKDIHRLIKKEPVLNRLDAWKSELPYRQGITFETLARDVLKSYGYELWFSKNTSKAEVLYSLFLSFSIHIWRTAQHFSKKIVRYSFDWKLLRNRLKFLLLKYNLID